MFNRSTLLFLLKLLLAIAPGCSVPNAKKETVGPKDFILEEKDLIPEGLAFDTVSRTIFVSSTHKRKIVRIDAAGRVSDFIKEKQDGIWSTIGMEVDARRRHLWVISSQAKEVLPLQDPDSLQWRSAIYQYNLETGALVDSCLLATKNVFLNDLTVAENGDVYITESIQSNIYRLKTGTDSLELFLSLKPYSFPNGINFSDQRGHLFVSTAEGVVKINLVNHRYELIKSTDSVNAKDIDGLTYYNGSLIGHQSTRVVRFMLNDKQDSITHSILLNSGPEFDSSTTGEIENGNYYFIVNSQVHSGIDFKNQVIKPMDSLENVIIRKISL